MFALLHYILNTPSILSRFTFYISLDRTAEKGGQGRCTSTPPAPFPGAKILFHVKLENIKFLHVNNMWDHSLLIEQDLSDKKYLALSEFVVLAVHWATIVTKNKFVSIVLNCKVFHFFGITQITTHSNIYLYWDHSVSTSLGKGSKRIRQQKMT